MTGIKTVGDFIRIKRHEKRISLSKMSKIMGMHKQTICRIENKGQLPTLRQDFHFSQVLEFEFSKYLEFL